MNPDRLYTYPDINVVCGELKLSDDRKDTAVNSTVLVEVLSPSTEARDRGFKFTHYRHIESLQEYVLVWQSEPRLEIYRRQPAGDWLLSEVSGLHLPVRKPRLPGSPFRDLFLSNQPVDNYRCQKLVLK